MNYLLLFYSNSFNWPNDQLRGFSSLVNLFCPGAEFAGDISILNTFLQFTPGSQVIT